MKSPLSFACYIDGGLAKRVGKETGVILSLKEAFYGVLEFCWA